MPRPNRPPEGHAGGGCKIRKRGCSSSSSSSSALRSYRLKRAIPVGRRGGATTPVPAWRINAISPPCSSVGLSHCSHLPPPHAGGKVNQPVSARKLATALWELNEIPAPRVTGNSNKQDSRPTRRGGINGRRDRAPEPVHSGSLPPHLSDPSHSPVSETTDRSGSGNHRRGPPRVLSQKLRLDGRSHRAMGSIIDGCSMEMETTRSHGLSPRSSAMGSSRNRLKDLSNSLTASIELLKILNHVWGLEEEQRSSGVVYLVPALHTQLQRARIQVDLLIEDRRSEQSEIKCLRRRFTEEKSAWKRKEQERIASATESVTEGLELEKRLRRRSERLNQELESELRGARTALESVTRELEGERRSREIIEQVCDELVRGIGEDKARAEEMKRESAEALEELEREREMLQLADMWREERVQMKLSEAKYQFERKNAAVEQLRSELEGAFLVTRGLEEEDEVLLGHVDDAGEKEEEEEGDDDDEVGSADSDLHSIELNMEDNGRGSCCWSYVNGDSQDNNRELFSIMEGRCEGRGSNRDKISRNSFTVERGTTSEVQEQEFVNYANFKHLIEGVDRGTSSEEGSLGSMRKLPRGATFSES